MTYKELCKIFRKNKYAKKITMNIVDFAGLLDDFKDSNLTNNEIEPICREEVLKTGFYAIAKIDGKELEIHVDKNVKPGKPVFTGIFNW